MQKIRYGFIAMCMLLSSVTFAEAQISIGIGLPNVSIGINLPLYPELVRVPGYPVYYAPQLDANYFFYDGMYWVYNDDNWYASSWYNGPWAFVQPEVVPAFILRIPVRYYRQPPVYFQGWYSNAPPRWGQHWGRNWEHRRSGWDRWERRSAPAPAPLPTYQRHYTRDRYPSRVEQQQQLRSRNYRYQPRNTAVRQHFQRNYQHSAPAPAQRGRQEQPRMQSPRQQEFQRSAPFQNRAPDVQRSQERQQQLQQQQQLQKQQQQRRGGENFQRTAPFQNPSQQQRRGDENLQRTAPVQNPTQQQHRGGENLQRTAPVQNPTQQRAPEVQEQRQRPGSVPREQRPPRTQVEEQKSRDRGDTQEPNRYRRQGQDIDEERGGSRN